MIIKKIDINSILPIIINIIIESLEDVNKFLNSINPKLYKSELVVFVSVKIDNLKDFSKLILSNNKTPERINKLIKNEIKIRNEIFIFSLLIFLLDIKIFLSTILFGLTNFKISVNADFKRI